MLLKMSICSSGCPLETAHLPFTHRCTTLTTTSFAINPLLFNVTTGWRDQTSHAERHSQYQLLNHSDVHNHMVFFFNQGAKKKENIHKHGKTTKEKETRARQQPKKAKLPYSEELTESWRQHNPTRRIKKNIEYDKKYNKYSPLIKERSIPNT